MPAILATMDWTPILSLLGTVVTGLLSWVVKSIAAKNAAAANESKQTQALLKLATIASSLAGKAWGQLGPMLQAAMADGSMSADERKQIEATIQGLLHEFVDEQSLNDIASTLGLPLPGIIAKIAATVIQTYAFAHDPAITTVSKLEYPISNTSDGSPGA